MRNQGQMTGTHGQDARATAGETPALRPRDRLSLLCRAPGPEVIIHFRGVLSKTRLAQSAVEM